MDISYEQRCLVEDFDYLEKLRGKATRIQKELNEATNKNLTIDLRRQLTSIQEKLATQTYVIRRRELAMQIYELENPNEIAARPLLRRVQVMLERKESRDETEQKLLDEVLVWLGERPITKLEILRKRPIEKGTSAALDFVKGVG